MATYIALIRKQDDSVFGVDFPDFPGCISAGTTLDEALQSARGALELHIEGMLEDEEELPEPSTLDEVMDDPHHQGAVPTLVVLPAKKGRAVRVNVTIDENLLKELDAAAAREGMTRSGFLAEAARSRLRGAI